MRIGVITFPGSLDDRDAQRAIRLAGAEPVALWHGEHDLQGVDAIVLPGGFSYGDYLRCGAIAARSPIMAEVIDAAERRDARARHLQRLPDPRRGAPAARRADPQRPRRLHLPRPAAARRERRPPPGRTASPSARRSPSRSRTARAGSSPTAETSTGSRARAASRSATSTSTPTARSTTSPASPTSAATSSASCRTPSTRSSPASAPTPALRCARGIDGLTFFTSVLAPSVLS